MRLDFHIFALFIETSSSLLSVSEVGLVLSVSPFCEAKAKTKAAIEEEVSMKSAKIRKSNRTNKALTWSKN